MADYEKNPIEHPEVRIGSIKNYGFGLLASIALSALSLGLVYGRAFAPPVLIGLITGIAFIMVAIQVYLFIDLDISMTQRWKTVCTALILPLIALMIPLTIWMFYTLQLRLMVPY